MNSSRWARISTLATATYTILLTFLLLAPNPLWFLQRNSIARSIQVSMADYVQHAAVYAVFACLIIWMFQTGALSRLAHGFGFVLAHSIVTELLQGPIPERTLDFRDVVANACGVIVGWLIGMAALRILPNRPRLQSKPQSSTLING